MLNKHIIVHHASHSGTSCLHINCGAITLIDAASQHVQSQSSAPSQTVCDWQFSAAAACIPLGCRQPSVLAQEDTHTCLAMCLLLHRVCADKHDCRPHPPRYATILFYH